MSLCTCLHWSLYIFDVCFDVHINLLSILMSIDFPRESALVELADAFPIEVSSIDVPNDLTYTKLITFGSGLKYASYCSTISVSSITTSFHLMQGLKCLRRLSLETIRWHMSHLTGIPSISDVHSRLTALSIAFWALLSKVSFEPSPYSLIRSSSVRLFLVLL